MEGARSGEGVNHVWDAARAKGLAEVLLPTFSLTE